MDGFLEHLIKKSDLENNEFFNYRQPKRQELPCEKPKYKKLTVPDVSDYVVFDFETTGLNCYVNKIIEIGAVRVENGKVYDTISTLIDPQQYIPAYISTKVHITNKMVHGMPYIEDVLPDFKAFIGDLPLIAHNAPFDMSFLLTNAERAGLDIENPVLDTLYLSRRYNKECAKHNLGYLTNFFGIKLDHAHRAACDALATQQLYELIRQKYINTCNNGNL